MPRRAEPAPSRFAVAAARAVARRIDEVDMSRAAVARVAGLSDSYLSERLMLRKSFTLSDIEALGRALHFEPADFLTRVDADIPPATASPRNVGAIGDPRLEERFAADRGDEAVSPEEAGD